MNELNIALGNLFQSIHKEVSEKYPKIKLDLVLSPANNKFIALASFTNITTNPADVLKFEKKFTNLLLSVLRKYKILLFSSNLESILNVDKDAINFKHNSMLEIFFENAYIKDIIIDATLTNSKITDRYYIFI